MKFHRSKQSDLKRSFNGKLGQGFTSADDLVEVDISSGDRPRPTFISAKLDSKCKHHDLLKGM